MNPELKITFLNVPSAYLNSAYFEGECVVVFCLKDEADQILAVQNVLMLNCQNQSKYSAMYLDDVANGMNYF